MTHVPQPIFNLYRIDLDGRVALLERYEAGVLYLSQITEKYLPGALVGERFFVTDAFTGQVVGNYVVEASTVLVPA